MIQLNLSKQASSPIAFNLNKANKFVAKLFWDCSVDLDVHFLLLKGGSLQDHQDIISTYNGNLVLRDSPSQNHTVGGKKPFMNTTQSVIHLGDARTGIQLSGATEADEELEINLPNIQDRDQGVFIITSHPPHAIKFKDVKDCRLVIEDDMGKQLLQANLTSEWDSFDVVQMGGIALDNGEWKFNPQACGINGDFNTVLGAYQ